ncbi:hypothetical protein L7F22_041681 [Adiantum nelumboides]|nr:hypothetical protein [Adiantum nelumboides]
MWHISDTMGLYLLKIVTMSVTYCRAVHGQERSLDRLLDVGKHVQEPEVIPGLDPPSGDPLLFAPFWKQNAKESAVLIPGWYRMGYQVVENSAYRPLTPSLEKEIRALHTLVGNAVTEDKYIVLGVGSMLLLNAAVASLAPNNGTPASVVSAVPYYGAYRAQTELLETSHYTWAGDANIFAEKQRIVNGSSIEFVTTPNNPDGRLRDAVVNGSNAFAIYDLAYYWPHFTAITAARDDDVMLFTLSKVTGHAGSRLGSTYAWVHCKQEMDEDCEASLFQAGIISRGGNIFGSSDRYARLSLLKRDSVFDNLVDRLSVMV